MTSDQNFTLLEAELRYTKEQLQTVIEQYEVSTEKLQSINEELLAVNEELNSKIEELSRAKSDLKNLIASTDIALLFLDAELRIKRYTPSITELFNVIPTDLERPFAHITGKLVYNDLVADASHVLHTQVRIRREIRTAANQWYIMQMTPYRNVEERIDGVVITFVEITDLRKVQAKLEKLNQALEARVAERTGQVRALSSSLTMAEQWERRRISQILHDNLQQLLYGLQIRTQLLLAEIAPLPQADLVAQIDEVYGLLREAIRATRTLSVELNPPVLQGEGLGTALRWLVHHMQQTYSLTVTFIINENGQDAEYTLAESKRMLLIQLVRELLFNVVKHADIKQATVTLYEDDDQLCLEVKDQGKGFDVKLFEERGSREGHFGLFSVHERLALFGGRLVMESKPQEGTCMTIIAPLFNGNEPAVNRIIE